MISDTYLTIADVSEGLYKEKGSRFLCYAHPVTNDSEVKVLLEGYKKTFYDARHICYAYRLGSTGETYRFNDDGEPSGTAGRPIHGQLLSHGITNTLVVVIRYFGGTKLGVSGLTKAYKQAAADALDNATVQEQIIVEKYALVFGYNAMNDVMRFVKEEQINITSQHMEVTCKLVISIRLSEIECVLNRLANLKGVAIEKVY